MRRYLDPESWLVSESAHLAEGLRKAATNHHRVLCVVDDQKRLVGSLSSGDVYRAVERSGGRLEDVTVREVMHARPMAAFVWESPALVQTLMRPGVDMVPLVNSAEVVVGVVTDESPQLEMGSRSLGPGNPCLVVAEIGNNHQGDVQTALELAKACVEAGADAVKFQLRTGITETSFSRDLGTEYVDDLLGRFNFTTDQMHEVLGWCQSQEIVAFCTPWDSAALRFLVAEGVPAVKISSADLTNSELISQATDTGLPLIISTGMSTEDEISRALAPLAETWIQYALLHTNSTYPAMPSQVNLRYMDRLRSLGSGIVGYSSHDLGLDISLAAVARGANVIEKHVTLDKSQEGNDHRVSLLPNELEQLVRAIRRVEESLGSDEPRKISQGEVLNRQALAKSLVWVSNLEAGTDVDASAICTVSGVGGLTPDRLQGIVGRKLTRSVYKDTPVSQLDIIDVDASKREFQMNATFGIPVRFHDYEDLTRDANVDLVEFHLSYRDLGIDVQEWLESRKLEHEVVVHSPELFEGDHVMDLASVDESHIQTSRGHLERVIAVAKRITAASVSSEPVRVVINAGGWSMNGFHVKTERDRGLNQILDVLTDYSFKHPDVRLLVQTMPPFPWHFGGQRFHNLFVEPEHLAALREAGFHICLDLSHSKLAAAHLDRPLADFFIAGGPAIDHIHVSDALPPAEEGLPIGQGDIDFLEVSHLYEEHCPSASFIAEVWQGHKEGGLLTWMALQELEKAGF